MNRSEQLEADILEEKNRDKALMDLIRKTVSAAIDRHGYYAKDWLPAIVDDVIAELESERGMNRETELRPYKKRNIGAMLRKSVFERDEYRCVKCHGHTDLTVDHKIPEVKGGETIIDNLQTLCRSCNSSKGTRSMSHHKNIHGGFRNVLLTSEELETLTKKFTDTPERIEVMSEYIAATGKKYRSHYAALLTWARRAEKRQDFLFKEKSTPPRRTPNDGQKYLSLSDKPPDWKGPLSKEESAEALLKLRQRQK